MDVISLFAELLNVPCVSIGGIAEQCVDGLSGLLMFVFDMNSDIHLAKTKNHMFIRQGVPDFFYPFVMTRQVEGCFSIKFIVTEQDCGVGYLGMLFKAAEGV